MFIQSDPTRRPWRTWRPRFGLRGLLALMAILCVLLAVVRLWLADEQIRWQKFTPQKLQQATAQGRVVLVNFTADWDLSSAYHKKFLFTGPGVRELVRERGIVPLEADYTNSNEEVRKQLESLRAKSVPVIAIYPAGNAPPFVLRDIISQDQLEKAIQSVAPPVASTSTYPAWYGGLAVFVLIGIAWLWIRRQNQRSTEHKSATFL